MSFFLSIRGEDTWRVVDIKHNYHTGAYVFEPRLSDTHIGNTTVTLRIFCTENNEPNESRSPNDGLHFFHANDLILQGCLLAFYYFRWYYVRELTSELKNYLKIIWEYRREISAACRLSFLYEKPVNKFPLNFNLPFRPSLRSITIAVCFLPASSPKTPDINDNLYLRLG